MTILLRGGLSVCVLCWSILLFGQSSFAEVDAAAQHLFELSLAELRHVKIATVVSKRVEAIHDTGGAVTLYTMQAIRQLGYYTLADLANIAPGYHSHSSGGETGLGTRGFRGNEFENGKHLLLVDGIPFHHLRSNKIPVEYDMPLHFARQVQFLRGPGSMLYGANAFYGVVDIAPQSPEKEGVHFNLFANYGSPFSQKNVAGEVFGKTSFGETTVSLSYFDRDASEYDVPDHSDPNAKLWDNQYSRFIFLKHKFTKTLLDGISLGLIYSSRDVSRGDGGSVNSPENETNWDTIVPYLKFEKAWTDTLSTTAHVRYNHSTEEGFVVIPDPFVPSVDYRINAEGYGGQFEVNYDFNDQANVLVGVDYDTRKILGSPHSFFIENRVTGPTRIDRIPAFGSSIQLFGVYGQLQYEVDFLHGTLLTVGGRYTAANYGHDSYSNFSPKVTLVQRLRDDLNLKLLYGRAFRSPTPKEIDQNLERSAGRGVSPEDINPELLESFELGLSFSRPTFTLEGNLYHIEIDDPIELVNQNNARFLNSKDEFDAWGGELGARYHLNKNLSVDLAYSYTDTDSQDSSETRDIPTQQARALVHYTDEVMDKSVGATVASRWVKDYTANRSIDKPSGYFATDLNASVGIWRGLELGIQIRNVWNEKHFFPNNSRKRVRLHERTIWGSLRYIY